MSSDNITRIIENASLLDSDLTSFLDDGISSILKERRDPYFTIAKQKIKSLITHEDVRADVEYTNKMITTLIELESKIHDMSVEYTFVEICLELVRDKNIITRDALVFLNEIHNSL